MGFGDSDLVRQSSILCLANPMVYVPLVKTLTARFWLAGMAEFTDILLREPRRIHFQESRVASEPKEFSVIATVVCGSEPLIAVLYMHTTERQMCMEIPKDSQLTTFTRFSKIGRKTFG